MKSLIITAIVLSVMVLSCREEKSEANRGNQTSSSVSATAPVMGDQMKVDEYPTPVTQVQPAYPKSALDAHTEGTVWLNVLVKADGKTADVAVMKVKGAPEFAQAAIDAAR